MLRAYARYVPIIITFFITEFHCFSSQQLRFDLRTKMRQIFPGEIFPGEIFPGECFFQGETGKEFTVF